MAVLKSPNTVKQEWLIRIKKEKEKSQLINMTKNCEKSQVAKIRQTYDFSQFSQILLNRQLALDFSGY